MIDDLQPVRFQDTSEDEVDKGNAYLLFYERTSET